MSIPPGNMPPNNYPPNNLPPGGYVPQPPKPAGSPVGKIVGFGCLGLFVLAGVIGVLLVRNVKHSLANPSKSDIFGIGVLAGQAGADGSRLQQAVVKYHAQHGTYPKSLMDLYTDGSIDGKLLHNGLDDSPDPAHVSWRYTPPAPNAPGDTPILREPYHITISGRTAPGEIVIDLNGKAGSGQTTGQPMSSGSPDQSPAPDQPTGTGTVN